MPKSSISTSAGQSPNTTITPPTLVNRTMQGITYPDDENTLSVVLGSLGGNYVHWQQLKIKDKSDQALEYAISCFVPFAIEIKRAAWCGVRKTQNCVDPFRSVTTGPVSFPLT